MMDKDVKDLLYRSDVASLDVGRIYQLLSNLMHDEGQWEERNWAIGHIEEFLRVYGEEKVEIWM